MVSNKAAVGWPSFDLIIMILPSIRPVLRLSLDCRNLVKKNLETISAYCTQKVLNSKSRDTVRLSLICVAVGGPASPGEHWKVHLKRLAALPERNQVQLGAGAPEEGGARIQQRFPRYRRLQKLQRGR